jgi:hypothetical protein
VKTIVLLAALSMSLLASAQTKIVSLNGMVRDTADRSVLQHAVIYLKDRVKSTLLIYTRSDSAGRFVINNLPTDTFVMVVTYPGYVDWIDTVVAGDKFIHVNGYSRYWWMESNFFETTLPWPPKILTKMISPKCRCTTGNQTGP